MLLQQQQTLLPRHTTNVHWRVVSCANADQRQGAVCKPPAGEKKKRAVCKNWSREKGAGEIRPEHTGHFVQPHVAAHCGGDIYSRRKPLFSSFGEHTAVCGSSVRQAVARPRHRQSVCIHNIHVAATCRPSVLRHKTRPHVVEQSGQCARAHMKCGVNFSIKLFNRLFVEIANESKRRKERIRRINRYIWGSFHTKK